MSIITMALEPRVRAGVSATAGDIVCIKEHSNPGSTPRWGHKALYEFIIVNLDVGDSINWQKARDYLNRPWTSDLILTPYSLADGEGVVHKKRFSILKQYIRDEYPVFEANVTWSLFLDPGTYYQPFIDIVWPASKVKRLIHDKKTGGRITNEVLGHIING